MKPVPNLIVYGIAMMLITAVLLVQSGCGSSDAGSTSPFYGKAVLGSDLNDPEGVVHFIVQGPKIYVDRNKDNVPQPDELNTSGEMPVIKDKNGDATYRIFELRLGVSQDAVSESLPQQLAMTVDVGGPFSYEQIGTILLKPDPEQATWIQFNGPIRLFNNQEGLTLFKGGNPVELQLFAGTIARGPGTQLGTSKQPPAPENNSDPLADSDDLRRITYIVPTQESPFPQVHVEFPTVGGPITKDFDLDKFC